MYPMTSLSWLSDGSAIDMVPNVIRKTVKNSKPRFIICVFVVFITTLGYG